MRKQGFSFGYPAVSAAGRFIRVVTSIEFRPSETAESSVDLASTADNTLPHLLRLLLMKVTFGISGKDHGTKAPSARAFISIASRPFKVRGELLGHENSLLVSLTVSMAVTDICFTQTSTSSRTMLKNVRSEASNRFFSIFL